MNVKFYLTSTGRSSVEKFLADCSQEIRSNFFDAISLLSSGQKLSMPLSRNLSSIHPGLHELRVKDRGGQIRVFYFVKKGEAIFLLHAFKKKTQELPLSEVNLVIKRIKEI